MGFSDAAVSKLTFKVQAANVIDASTNFQWYESALENSPKITKDRIFLEYNTVTANPPTSIANLVTLTSNGGALYNIVSNNYFQPASQVPLYHQLTQATNGNDTTYVSYDNPADRSSDRKNNWINPSSVPVNGIPVPYYTIEIYYLVGTTYTQLQATDAATISGEVGWVWNYDQGLLLLSIDAINFLKNQNSGTMPELYVRGWRYIGDTGVGTGGDKYADCTTQTIVVPVTTQTISLTIGTDLSYTQGQSIRLTSGSNLILGTVSSYVAGTGAIVIAVTSSSGSITTSATWCIALGGGGSGGSIEVESFDYSDDPNNPGTPIGLTTLTTALEGLQIPTDLNGGGLIAAETSPGSNIVTLNTRFDTQISPTTNAQAVGGISNSETAASLSTLTFTELFNKLLFPTLLPKYKRPLFTITKTTTPSQSYYQPGQSVTVNTSTTFTKQDSGGIDGTIITNRNGSSTPSMGTATSGTTGNLASQFGFGNNNTPNTTNSRTASESFTTSIPTTTQTASDTFISNTGWLQGNPNKDSTGALDTRTPASSQNMAATVDDPIAALASYNSNSTSISSVYPWYYFYSSTKPTSSNAVAIIQGAAQNPGGYSVQEILEPSNGTLNVLNYTPAAVFTVVAYPFLANNSNFPVKTKYFLTTLNSGAITNLFDPVVTVNISRNGGPWSNIQYRMHISTSVQSSTVSPLQLRNN